MRAVCASETTNGAAARSTKVDLSSRRSAFRIERHATQAPPAIGKHTRAHRHQQSYWLRLTQYYIGNLRLEGGDGVNSRDLHLGVQRMLFDLEKGEACEF